MSLAGLVDEGVDLDRAVAVTRLLTEAHLQMIEGQYLDLSYESRPDIGMSDYLDMISRKTGALIRCSLHVGALIGTRNQAAVEAFRKCGESLGLVFQIRDDVLGVWGDERVTGKSVGADIRRKKNSLPVVYAMSRAVGADKEFLESVYRRDGVDDSDIDGVLGDHGQAGRQDLRRPAGFRNLRPRAGRSGRGRGHRRFPSKDRGAGALPPREGALAGR